MYRVEVEPALLCGGNRGGKTPRSIMDLEASIRPRTVAVSASQPPDLAMYPWSLASKFAIVERPLLPCSGGYFGATYYNRWRLALGEIRNLLNSQGHHQLKVSQYSPP